MSLGNDPEYLKLITQIQEENHKDCQKTHDQIFKLVEENRKKCLENAKLQIEKYLKTHKNMGYLDGVSKYNFDLILLLGTSEENASLGILRNSYLDYLKEAMKKSIQALFLGKSGAMIWQKKEIYPLFYGDHGIPEPIATNGPRIDIPPRSDEDTKKLIDTLQSL